MATLENEQNNAFGSHPPPLYEQAYYNPVHTQKHMAEPIVFVGRRRQDPMVFILKFVKLIITVYLVFVALPHAVFEAFPNVPCQLPVVSEYTPRCERELGHPGGPVIEPDFITLAQLQSRLEYVMEDSASSSLVAVDIKDSEMALRDLGTLVRHSSLSNKDALGRDLRLFVDDAKTTSGSLQKFGSHVWGVVDRIVSENEYTLIMLEGLSQEKSGGFLGGVINIPILEQRTAVANREKMGERWLQSIDAMDKALRKLIHKGQANIGLLQMLEERLDNIQDMAIAEEEKLRGEEREFKKRWFPDEEKLQSHTASLELLQMVQDNRKSALNHVGAVLFKLEQISHDLDDLREGVATPRIIADSSNVPIEAHIRNMRSATERLVNGQSRMREVEDTYRRRKSD